MAKIDSTEFGKIVVDGKAYNEDIVIDVAGNVKKRSNISKTYYGTHHVICREEIRELLECRQRPEVLVIGLGQYGACRLEQSVSRECNKHQIKLIAEPTPKAIKSFNETTARKAGLFHLTC